MLVLVALTQVSITRLLRCRIGRISDMPDIQNMRLEPHNPPPSESVVQPLPAIWGLNDIAPTDNLDPLCAMMVTVDTSIGKSMRVVAPPQGTDWVITPERADMLIGWSFCAPMPGVISVCWESIETLRLVHCFIFGSYTVKYRAFGAVSEVRECDSELEPVEFPVWELICRDFRTT